MNDNDTFKKYLIEEFYDDYREGLITRRTFIRRVAFITGSMAATVVAMSAAGCRPVELPSATESMPEAATPAAGAEAGAAFVSALALCLPLALPSVFTAALVSSALTAGFAAGAGAAPVESEHTR